VHEGKRDGKRSAAAQGTEHLGELGVAGTGESLPGTVARNPAGIGSENAGALADPVVVEGLGVELGMATAGMGERIQELVFGSPLGTAIADAALMAGSMVC
jgi:hypothetical protein